MADTRKKPTTAGILTEMPLPLARAVNKKVRLYQDGDFEMPVLGKGSKPAGKMGIQAAILLYFESRPEEERRAIIRAGLERYATLLEAPDPAKESAEAPLVTGGKPAEDPARPKRSRRA